MMTSQAGGASLPPFIINPLSVANLPQTVVLPPDVSISASSCQPMTLMNDPGQPLLTALQPAVANKPMMLVPSAAITPLLTTQPVATIGPTSFPQTIKLGPDLTLPLQAQQLVTSATPSSLLVLNQPVFNPTPSQTSTTNSNEILKCYPHIPSKNSNLEKFLPRFDNSLDTGRSSENVLQGITMPKLDTLATSSSSLALKDLFQNAKARGFHDNILMSNGKKLVSATNVLGPEEMGTQSNDNDLSQVLSALPAGWRIVGLTNLDTVNKSGLSSTLGLPLSTRTPSPTGMADSAPKVICVDLNAAPSLPLASVDDDTSKATAAKSLTCSAKLSAPSSTNVLTIKREQESDNEDEDDDVQISPGKHNRMNFIKLENLGDESSARSDLSVPCGLLSPVKKEVVDGALLCHSSKECETSTRVISGSSPTPSQWKIVGVTSLPATSVTHTSVPSLASISNAAELQLSSSAGTSNLQFPSSDLELASKLISQKATILNIPSPKAVSVSKPTKLSNLQPSLPLTLVPGAAQPPQLPVKGDMEMKWTIVGVTVAPSTPAVSSPNLNQTSTLSIPQSKSSIPNGFKATSSTPSSEPNTNRFSHNRLLDKMKSLISQTSMQRTNLESPPIKSSPTKLVSPQIELLSPTLDATVKKQQAHVHVPSDLLSSGDEWKIVGVTHLDDNKVANPPAIFSPSPLVIPTPILSTPTPTNTLFPQLTPSLAGASYFNSLLAGHMASGLLNNISDNKNELASTSAQSQASPNSAAFNLQQFQMLQLLKDHLEQQQKNLLPSVPQSSLPQSPNLLSLIGLADSQQASSTSANPKPPATQTSCLNNPLSVPHVCPSSSNTSNANDHSQSTKFETSPSNSNGKARGKVSKRKHMCGKADWLFHQVNGKEMSSKYTKKNTVSHLLKLKRMKKKGEEEPPFSLQDNDFVIDREGKVSHLLGAGHGATLPLKDRLVPNDSSSRKWENSTSDSEDSITKKISLRSGTQLSHYESEDDFTAGEASLIPKEQQQSNQLESETPVITEYRSAARKRKLKIPRKMVADMDYHPFDESSDSN